MTFSPCRIFRIDLKKPVVPLATVIASYGRTGKLLFVRLTWLGLVHIVAEDFHSIEVDDGAVVIANARRIPARSVCIAQGKFLPEKGNAVLGLGVAAKANRRFQVVVSVPQWSRPGLQRRVVEYGRRPGVARRAATLEVLPAVLALPDEFLPSIRNLGDAIESCERAPRLQNRHPHVG